jgi:hypothetical protein
VELDGSPPRVVRERKAATTLAALVGTTNELLEARRCPARWVEVGEGSFGATSWLLAPPSLIPLFDRYGLGCALTQAADESWRNQLPAKSCYLLESYLPPPSDSKTRCVFGRLEPIRECLERMLDARNLVLSHEALSLVTVQLGRVDHRLDLLAFVTVRLADGEVIGPSAYGGTQIDVTKRVMATAVKADRLRTAEVRLDWDSIVAIVPLLVPPVLRSDEFIVMRDECNRDELMHGVWNSWSGWQPAMDRARKGGRERRRRT